MQVANAMLSLAGDHGNQVPKYGITVAEIVVLRHVHGGDAVKDIEPTGDVERSDFEERDRLAGMFARPVGVKSPVDEVYPGAMARVHKSFVEAFIPDDCFKTVSRVSRATPAAPAPVVPPAPAKRLSKAEKAAVALAAAEAEAAELARQQQADDQAEDILS